MTNSKRIFRAPGRIDSAVSRESAFLMNNLLFAALAFVVLLGTVFPLVAEAVRGSRLSVGEPYFDRMTTPIGIALLFLMAAAPALPWRATSGEVLRGRFLVPAWIGGALKIKPILTLEEEITPVERVRTRARSLERLRDYARQRHESGADGWVVQHIQDEETASSLADDCREIFGCEPVFVSEIGAVLGAHVGPGLLGVGSVPTTLIS